MDFDWTQVLSAVGGVVIGVLVMLYSNFRKAAAADAVANWKDIAVKEVDALVDAVQKDKPV